MYKLIVNRQCARDVRSTSNNGKNTQTILIIHSASILYYITQKCWDSEKKRINKEEKKMSAKKRHRFHRTSYSLRYLVSTQALNVFQDKSEQVIDTSRLQCICA